MIEKQMTFIYSVTPLLFVLSPKSSRTVFLEEADYKPLFPLLNSNRNHIKCFGGEQFRLHFMRFFLTIAHVSGKELQTDDTISRSPVSEEDDSREEAFHHKVKAFVKTVVRISPSTGSEERLRLT